MLAALRCQRYWIVASTHAVDQLVRNVNWRSSAAWRCFHYMNFLILLIENPDHVGLGAGRRSAGVSASSARIAVRPGGVVARRRIVAGARIGSGADDDPCVCFGFSDATPHIRNRDGLLFAAAITGRPRIQMADDDRLLNSHRHLCCSFTCDIESPITLSTWAWSSRCFNFRGLRA